MSDKRLEVDLPPTVLILLWASAASLALSGASAGGFCLVFLSSAWPLHAGDCWRASAAC